MGRLTSEISPDTGTTRYGYDGVGNSVWKKDAGNTLVTYDHDALYRPTAENFSQFGSQRPYTIGYIYDQGTNGKGRLPASTTSRVPWILSIGVKGVAPTLLTQRGLQDAMANCEYDYDGFYRLLGKPMGSD